MYKIRNEFNPTIDMTNWNKRLLPFRKWSFQANSLICPQFRAVWVGTGGVFHECHDILISSSLAFGVWSHPLTFALVSLVKHLILSSHCLPSRRLQCEAFTIAIIKLQSTHISVKQWICVWNSFLYKHVVTITKLFHCYLVVTADCIYMKQKTG